MPGFGAFLAHTASARIDDASNTLYPPTKIISFNQQLSKNDGLLVSHISKSKNLAYEQLLDEVQNEAKVWNERLNQGESIELPGIGKLLMNHEGSIQFKPEEKVNYLASSFGLSSFAASPILREELKEEVEVLEDEIPFIFTPEKRKTSGIRPLLKYAAIGLVLVSLGVSGYQFYRQQGVNEQFVQAESKAEVARHIQEATFFETTPLELPSLPITLIKKKAYKGPMHHIIAGAFRIRENADKKVAQLKEKGYDAQYIGANAFGLHQVAYASFQDNEDALSLYRKLKKEVSPDVWILSDK